MNRPEVRNALGPIRVLLHETFQDLFANDKVRAVILTGAGGHFCAGGDIKNFGTLEPTAQITSTRSAQTMVRGMLQGDKPLIAAVEGYAAGAGAGLACACDIIVGDPLTKFFLSFSKIGMVPDMGLMATLSHRLGLAHARRALLQALTYAGEDAYKAGLIDEFADEGGVQDRAVAVAADLAEKPSVAMASLKRGFYVAAGTIDAVVEYEAAAMAVALTGREVKEGAAAFLEKRDPKYHD